MEDDAFLENVTFDGLIISAKASLTKMLTQEEINLFTAISGDVNPAHMNPEFAKSSIFHQVVGHGM